MLKKIYKKVKKNQREIDEQFMKMALMQAKQAFDEGEIPIGAVLVHQEKVIAKSYNQVELLQDATAHAELVLVSSSGEFLQSKYLNDCTLYVTLEPCAMCAGAIGWSQVSRLVFGATDVQKGYRNTAPNVLHPKCEVAHGILAKECEQLLFNFFDQLRN